MKSCAANTLSASAVSMRRRISNDFVARGDEAYIPPNESTSAAVFAFEEFAGERFDVVAFNPPWLRGTVEGPLHAEHGELVGDHAQVPAGRIGGAVPPVGKDLPGRHRLVPLAERTRRVRGDLDGFQPEVLRSLAAVGGDDHPPAGNRIFT